MWHRKRTLYGGISMGKTVTICFTNNKGGSGKSYHLFELRCGWWLVPERKYYWWMAICGWICLWHFQRTGVLEHAQGEKNLYHAIGKQEDLTDYIVHTPYENLDLVPSSTLMSSIEYELLPSGRESLSFGNACRRLKIQKFMIISDRCTADIGRLGHEHSVRFG